MSKQTVFGSIICIFALWEDAPTGHLTTHTHFKPRSTAVGVSRDQGWGLMGEVAAGESSNKQNLALTLDTHTYK